MPPDRGIRMLCPHRAAIEHDELHQRTQLGEAMPTLQPRNIVFADEIKKLRATFARPQLFDRIDRVRRRGAMQLDDVDRETRLARDRRPQHFQARFGSGGRMIEFVGRNSGRDKDNYLELEFFHRVAREDQMTVMDWIKRAAINADLFQWRRKRRFLFPDGDMKTSVTI